MGAVSLRESYWAWLVFGTMKVGLGWNKTLSWPLSDSGKSSGSHLMICQKVVLCSNGVQWELGATDFS